MIVMMVVVVIVVVVDDDARLETYWLYHILPSYH
jgi:hypothetical protein